MLLLLGLLLYEVVVVIVEAAVCASNAIFCVIQVGQKPATKMSSG